MFVTNDSAYDDMWRRLSEDYDDPGLSVQSALGRLVSLKPVIDSDFTGLV